MLRFAHWKTTPAIRGLETAEEFVVDIPEGTSRESVIAILALQCGASVQQGDGLGFESEWPEEIKKEFESLDLNSEIIWRWGKL
jgi:hypothetical protein